MYRRTVKALDTTYVRHYFEDKNCNLLFKYWTHQPLTFEELMNVALLQISA